MEIRIYFIKNFEVFVAKWGGHVELLGNGLVFGVSWWLSGSCREREVYALINRLLGVILGRRVWPNLSL